MIDNQNKKPKYDLNENLNKLSNGSYYGYGKWVKSCVHKPLLDGLLFCGGIDEAEDFYKENQDVKLWVSLNKNPQRDLPFDSENKLFTTKTRIIYYPIKDRETPVYEGFSLLIDLILEHLNNKQKVIINCFGGHGRTGLVLSCAMGKLKPAIPDIIEYCRNIYCKKIIESLEQAEFVFKFLNKALPAEYESEFDFSRPLAKVESFPKKKKKKKKKNNAWSNSDHRGEFDDEDEYFPNMNCGMCGQTDWVKYEPSIQMYLCKKCRRKFYATGTI